MLGGVHAAQLQSREGKGRGEDPWVGCRVDAQGNIARSCRACVWREEGRGGADLSLNIVQQIFNLSFLVRFL